MIRSANASMPKYGLSPVKSHTQPPVGASAARIRSVTAGSVRRDGVTTTPTLSRSAIVARSAASLRTGIAGPAGNGRCCRPAAPRPAAAGNGASRSRQASASAASALRRHPMQRGAGDEDIRPGQFVMAVGDDQVEAADIHPRILHLHHPHRFPPQRRQHRSGHAAAADRQRWQRRPHRVGHRRQRVGPELRGDPLPRCAGFSSRISGARPAASARPRACERNPARALAA